MGTNSLAKLAAAPTKVAATTTQHNDIIDTLQGHIVMRDSAGAVEDGVSDIGRTSSGRPRNLYLSGDIVQNGQTLNTANFLLSRTGVQSGAAKASGFPQFLEAVDETNAVRILGNTTSLEMTIDGQAYALETDLDSDTLAYAPNMLNTCLVNDSELVSDHYWAHTIGEFGYWINVDTIGSQIETLNNTIQCFKIVNAGSEAEVFIAKIDVDNTGAINNRLIPILRGIGGTKRIVINNNNTITLLKAHYIFLDNDLSTIDTTLNFPSFSATAPAAPATGDYWWDVINKTWKRYSGVSWETLGRIYLGYAIAHSAGVGWVEHVDFDLAWDSDFIFGIGQPISNTQYSIEAPVLINVAGEKIKLSENMVIDTTTDLMPGVAVPGSGILYAYIDKNGTPYISNECPRKFNNRLGAYHPNEYYRCVSVLFFVATAILGGFSYVPENNFISFGAAVYGVDRYDGGISDALGFELKGGGYYVPPMATAMQLQGRSVYSGAVKHQRQTFKSVSENIGREIISDGLFDYYPRDASASERIINFTAEVNFVKNTLMYVQYKGNDFDFVYVLGVKLKL